MKTYKIISIAALAIAMTACTSEEASTSQPVVSGGGIPFRATVSTGATTRAVTENTTDQKLETAWTVGEQVALIHNDVVDVMKVSEIDDATKTATITGSITGSPANGDDVTVVYPASAVDSDTKAVKTDLLAAQDGTLATISSKLDLCQSSGAKLKVGAGVASLNGMVKLAPQMSIVKFSLSDGTDPLTTKSFVIKDGEDNVVTTVTAASELSDLFIAMAPATDATYSFSAVVGDFFWLYSKTGVTLKAGTYYKSPITMTISKKAGEISYATTSISKTFGDDNFTNPLTITGDGKVSYSSSDTKVAEVNSETGEVTIKGNGTATIKATVTDGPTYTYVTTEVSYTLGVGTATMTVTAEGYTGTYDGEAHSIKVTAPEGATVKYGEAEGTYDLDTNPTYKNAGTYTVYYQVTKASYDTVSGSATVTINKADMTVTAEGYSGVYDGLDHSITVTAPEGATVKYGTSADNCTETSLSYKEVGTYTIFYEVTKDNYNTVTGSATVDISLSTMTVTATGYTGTYDGDEHGITVTAPTNASVRYGETEGKYDKTSSPTYTDAGTHTVYYQVKKVGYTTVTGSATVTINKAAGSIKFTETSVTKNYGDVAFKNDTFSIIGDGVVTYTSSDTSVASVSNVSPNNGQVSILGTGTATITATVADGTNYTYAKKTAEYTLTVKPTSGTQDYNNGGTQTW